MHFEHRRRGRLHLSGSTFRRPRISPGCVHPRHTKRIGAKPRHTGYSQRSGRSRTYPSLSSSVRPLQMEKRHSWSGLSTGSSGSGVLIRLIKKWAFDVVTVRTVANSGTADR